MRDFIKSLTEIHVVNNHCPTHQSPLYSCPTGTLFLTILPYSYFKHQMVPTNIFLPQTTPTPLGHVLSRPSWSISDSPHPPRPNISEITSSPLTWMSMYLVGPDRVSNPLSNQKSCCILGHVKDHKTISVIMTVDPIANACEAVMPLCWMALLQGAIFWTIRSWLQRRGLQDSNLTGNKILLSAI